MKPVVDVAGQIADKRIGRTRGELKDLPPAEQRKFLRAAWSELLGDFEPDNAKLTDRSSESLDGVHIERFVLRSGREIAIPIVLLTPGRIDHHPPQHAPGHSTEPPVSRAAVVMIAQSGKAALLQKRSAEIASLLNSGIAVCLPDLRGTGETRLGRGRGRRSWSTSVSATELMLGQTLVGSRLKDLRTVLRVLGQCDGIDADRLALWGDSLAETNARDERGAVPRGIDSQPHLCEPLGHVLALLGALYEERIAAVVSARGGLSGFRAALNTRYCRFPHDIVVPGALTAGDLADVTAALAPRPLFIAGLVGGANRRLTPDKAAAVYTPAIEAYRSAAAENDFALRQQAHPNVEFAQWLATRLAP